MKKLLLIVIANILVMLSADKAFAQKQGQEKMDSLLTQLRKEKEDTNKVYLYSSIIFEYNSLNPDEGLKYKNEALLLANKLDWKSGIAFLEIAIGRAYWKKGNLQEALNNHFDALKIFTELKYKSAIVDALTAIGQDYADAANYPEALKYFKQALGMYQEMMNHKADEGNIYLLLSWVCTNQGLYGESSKYNFEALKIFRALGDKYGVAIATSNLGSDNLLIGNLQEALKYQKQSLEPLREIGDKSNESSTYSSIGNIYKQLGNYSEAIANHLKAIEVAKSITDHTAIGNAYVGLANVYMLQGNLDKALSNYLLAAESFQAVSNKILLANVYNFIGTCYIKQKKFSEARKYFDESLKMAKDQNSKVAFSNYYGAVEVLDSITGNWKNAYFNYKKFVLNRDSIFNKENTKKITQTQMQYEFDKKEATTKAEQEKKDMVQRNVRNSIAAGLISALLILIVVFRQRNKVKKEKKRSDELLLNILPSEVAEELKNTGATVAKQYNDVSVLFTDFVNFTGIGEQLSPTELVAEIHKNFTAFDAIIEKHGLEKIKTIGDAYLAVCGLPHERKDHAQRVVKAAQEIKEYIASGNGKFQIRIGIHSGPVVAGIVGVKKFAYDIWGDTVNTANRMEQNSEAGKINISGSTYALVKDEFACVHRGKIDVKGKGDVDMYFVEY